MTQPRTRTRPGCKQLDEAPVIAAVPDAAPAPTVAAGAPGVPHILTAIRQVMQAVTSVGKDSFNEQQRFKFRGIDDVLNALGPAMREAGITAFPHLMSSKYEQVNIGTNRTLTGHVVLEVRYDFTSLVDGSVSPVVVPGEAMDVGDKAYSKAMSVAFRTALIQLFALPTGEPDPDHDTYTRSPDEACRVQPSQGRADRPQERAAEPRAAQARKPTTDELSRWEGQLWEVGADGIHAVAVEIWNAGAWEAPVPGKESRTMVMEIVDRMACMATSSTPAPTREQIRQMWNVAGNLTIIDMHVTSGEGVGPTLRSVLQEVGESLQRAALQAAAATENGHAITQEAANSWDDTFKEESRHQESGPA